MIDINKVIYGLQPNAEEQLEKVEHELEDLKKHDSILAIHIFKQDKIKELEARKQFLEACVKYQKGNL